MPPKQYRHSLSTILPTTTSHTSPHTLRNSEPARLSDIEAAYNPLHTDSKDDEPAHHPALDQGSDLAWIQFQTECAQLEKENADTTNDTALRKLRTLWNSKHYYQRWLWPVAGLGLGASFCITLWLTIPAVINDYVQAKRDTWCDSNIQCDQSDDHWGASDADWEKWRSEGNEYYAKYFLSWIALTYLLIGLLGHWINQRRILLKAAADHELLPHGLNMPIILGMIKHCFETGEAIVPGLFVEMVASHPGAPEATPATEENPLITAADAILLTQTLPHTQYHLSFLPTKTTPPKVAAYITYCVQWYMLQSKLYHIPTHNHHAWAYILNTLPNLFFGYLTRLTHFLRPLINSNRTTLASKQFVLTTFFARVIQNATEPTLFGRTEALEVFRNLTHAEQVNILVSLLTPSRDAFLGYRTYAQLAHFLLNLAYPHDTDTLIHQAILADTIAGLMAFYNDRQHTQLRDTLQAAFYEFIEPRLRPTLPDAAEEESLRQSLEIEGPHVTTRRFLEAFSCESLQHRLLQRRPHQSHETNPLPYLITTLRTEDRSRFTRLRNHCSHPTYNATHTLTQAFILLGAGSSETTATRTDGQYITKDAIVHLQEIAFADRNLAEIISILLERYQQPHLLNPDTRTGSIEIGATETPFNYLFKSLIAGDAINASDFTEPHDIISRTHASLNEIDELKWTILKEANPADTIWQTLVTQAPHQVLDCATRYYIVNHPSHTPVFQHSVNAALIAWQHGTAFLERQMHAHLTTEAFQAFVYLALTTHLPRQPDRAIKEYNARWEAMFDAWIAFINPDPHHLKQQAHLLLSILLLPQPPQITDTAEFAQQLATKVTGLLDKMTDSQPELRTKLLVTLINLWRKQQKQNTIQIDSSTQQGRLGAFIQQLLPQASTPEAVQLLAVPTRGEVQDAVERLATQGRAMNVLLREENATLRQQATALMNMGVIAAFPELDAYLAELELPEQTEATTHDAPVPTRPSWS